MWRFVQLWWLIRRDNHPAKLSMPVELYGYGGHASAQGLQGSVSVSGGPGDQATVSSGSHRQVTQTPP